MANQKTLFGDTYVTEDNAIAISIERYNELIKKEVLFDELTKEKQPLVLLSAKLEFNKEEN